jgi:hypothetical protein
VRLVRLLGLFFMAIALTRCAKVPQAVVDEAKAALATAARAEAPLYAADDFAKADTLVTSMEADIAAQAAKSPLSRSYRDVAALAAQAAEAAKQASDAAAAGRQQVNADVARMLPEVEKELNEADARIAQAAAVRGIKLDVAQIRAQVQAGRKGLEDARAAAGAKPMDARNKLQAISEMMAAASKAVDQAMKAPR